MTTSPISHLVSVLILIFSLLLFTGNTLANPICNNSIIEGLEECDNGPNNSDTLPDRCRTNCLYAHCGDGVTDSNEECDEGSRNNDEIPGACRTDCKRAYCGDGVIDYTFGEECDFAIDDSTCGLNCQSCTTPQDNMQLYGYSYVKLCSGEWHLSDNGSPGVLQVSAPYTMLDCNGAKLVGDGKGSIGILISGKGSVIRNCELKGFTTGIKITAADVGLFNNKLCGNYKDIISESGGHGLENECKRVTNWQENGQAGCTIKCPASTRTPTKVTTKVTGDIKHSTLSTNTKQTKAVKSAPINSNQKMRTTQRSPTQTSTSRYRFYEMAEKARWSSKAGKVVFGSDRIPEAGIVKKLAYPISLNGKRVTSVLFTQPDRQTNGYIQGFYPYQRLSKNAKFNALIALNPPTPAKLGAKFELIIGEGKSKQVVASRVIQGGRTVRFNADLSRWADKKIFFILRVSSIKQGQVPPPAIWVDPQVVN